MGLYPSLVLPVYVTPAVVRGMLGTSDQNTNDDSLLLWMADDVSRKIEEVCNRRFYPYYDTVLLDWQGRSFELDLPADFISLTTLTNGDGNAIPATSGSTTVILYYPQSEYPRYKIQLNISGGYVFLFNSTYQQAISVNGLWGYPSDENTGRYSVSTSATVQNTTSQNATTTSLLTQTGNFYAGQMVLIGTEFELIQSVTIGTPNDTLTVVRGACGSTAAAHLNGVAINQVLYHPAIVRAAARLLAWNYNLRNSPLFGTSSISGMGQVITPLAIPADIMDDLMAFRRGH